MIVGAYSGHMSESSRESWIYRFGRSCFKNFSNRNQITKCPKPKDSTTKEASRTRSTASAHNTAPQPRIFGRAPPQVSWHHHNGIPFVPNLRCPLLHQEYICGCADSRTMVYALVHNLMGGRDSLGRCSPIWKPRDSLAPQDFTAAGIFIIRGRGRS